MDPILAQGNIALTKKIKKAYEMNRHFLIPQGLMKIPFIIHPYLKVLAH
jgi:hypothetical protein